jgi:hypothetical protein
MKKILIVICLLFCFTGLFAENQDNNGFGLIAMAGIIGSIQKSKSKIHGKELRNSGQLLNSGGAFAPSDFGYQYAIDTLTYIREKIIDQTFYEIAPADFFTVDIGEAAYASQIESNQEVMTGGDFFAGDTNAGGNMGDISTVNIGLAPMSIPTQFWIKGVNWNIIEIKQAAQFRK